MPARTGPELTTWRTAPYRVELCAWIHQPRIVFQAQVNQSTFTYPIMQVTYDNVTVGAYADAEPELTILFGTTQGADDRGRQRVRLNNAGVYANGTTLYFGRSSLGTGDGEVRLADNTWITVLELRQIWATPPFITKTGQMFKDGDIVFGNNKSQPPLSNAGPDHINIIDPITEVITVDFGQTACHQIHPAASASLTHLWEFIDGTPATSTSAAPTGVTFPQGKRYIRHTVTNSLGISSTSHALVVAVTEDELLQNWQVNGTRTLRPDGQNLSIDVRDTLPTSTYPDGTEVLIFKREYFGDEQTEMGGISGRKHMVFAGWVQSEDAEGRATNRGFLSKSTLKLVDAAGRLKTLPGWPQTVERRGVPNKWYRQQAATAGRYINYLLRWHSNVLTRVDLQLLDDFAAYPFPSLQSDGSSLYDQVDVLCQAIGHMLTCDVNNRLLIKVDPMLQATEDRISTVIVPLEAGDWEEWRYTHTRPPRVHWDWGDAIKAVAQSAGDKKKIDAFMVVAPGTAPGQGLNSQNSTKQLVNDLIELRTREGHRYRARMNARFGYIDLKLRYMGDVGIDPALMEWVTLDIPSSVSGPRGRVMTAQRCLPVEAQYSYNHKNGTAVQRLLLEREEIGTLAVRFVPADENKNGTTPTPAPIDIFPPPAPIIIGDGLLPKGVATLAGFNQDGKVYLTADGNTPSWYGGPTWLPYVLATLGMTGTLQDFVVDPHCPKYAGSGTSVDGWVVTTLEIGKITDIFGVAGTPVYTAQHTFAVANDFATIQNSRGRKNWIVCVTYRRDSPGTFGTKVAYSTNGSTWTENVLTAFVHSEPTINNRPTLHVSPHTPGLCYVGAYSATNVGRLYRSTNYGASFTIMTSPTGFGLNQGGFLHVPYQDATDLLLYYGVMETGPSMAAYKRSLNGSTETDISPAVGLGPRDLRSIHSSDGNKNKMAMVAFDLPGDANERFLYTSPDGGTNWTLRQLVTLYRSVSVGSVDYKTLLLWGAGGAFGVSNDLGVTIDDRMGDIATYSPGLFVNFVGG